MTIDTSEFEVRHGKPRGRRLWVFVYRVDGRTNSFARNDSYGRAKQAFQRFARENLAGQLDAWLAVPEAAPATGG